MDQGVLCSGSIIYDTVVRPVDEAPWGTTTFVDSLECHVGGNGANTSLALATLGVPVRLLGVVGNDAQGAFVLERLRHAGVDIDLVRVEGEPTAATIAIVNRAGDRKFLHRLGASAKAFRDPLEFDSALTRGMTHYHLASLFLLPQLRTQAPRILERARSAGLSTSLDTNWDATGRWMLDIEPCLPYLDFLFMNEDEMRRVTGHAEPAAAAQLVLEKGVRTAVMKLGARGCGVYTADRELCCPAFDVEVKDTTGAGDCFVAGFLSALLRGHDLEQAATFANAVGALTVQVLGAADGVLSRERTESWMQAANLKV